jgi:hypothetical protein
MANPIRQGQLARDKQGKYLVIAPNGKGYKFEQAILVVWDMCDGQRSEQQIIRELADRTGGSTSQVSKTVPMIIAKLRTLNLIG